MATERDWTRTIDDPEELRSAFAGDPDARYRPITAWWWSGEELEEERLWWQLERIVELGCGGIAITGFAPHGPAGGSVGDDPRGFSGDWLDLYRAAMERAGEEGLGGVALSPFGPTLPIDVPKLLRDRPDLRGEKITTRDGVRVEPFGFDWGKRAAVDALFEEGTLNHRYLEAIGDLLGDEIVALFEDEMWSLPRWSPTFADEFRELKGYDPVIAAFDRDVGPRTPALRWDLFDVATTRAEGSYTRKMDDHIGRHGLLGGFDQMGRQGSPILLSAYYLDPFRTMAWSNAPGMDQMGDARFHLSLADIYEAPRVWLEGFHSHGWGMSLDQQMRLLYEFGREGANLYLPHGMYYAQRAFWWEWAPPEIGWRQPYARHYPAFAERCGRLMTALSAGRHVPEVAVLYPVSTVWADTTGYLEWGDAAQEAQATYLELFGMHGAPSGQHPEQAATPSLLAEAGYDRITVDEANVDRFDIPVILPACRCLQTDTVDRLIALAESGTPVVVVGPPPSWSAERGRDDERFADKVERLLQVADVVDSAEEVPEVLPPPRVEGLKAQWREVAELDLLFITGTGQVRLRGMADRRPERWDLRAGTIEPIGATTDGDDLLLDLDGPANLIGLPVGEAEAPAEVSYRTVPLPEVWECEYLEWGQNRWGDYRLPPNEGTPPVERRTFAHREGDDASWRSAPVTPEDVQHPTRDLGFEDRMGQARSRPEPGDRMLGDGWREVVSTYGPKAVLDGDELLEHSERYGVEDLVLSTPLGLKGWVEPVKADLGEEGAGRVVSHAHVPEDVDTHLVVEGAGVVSVQLDGEDLIGPVDAGIVAAPVHLTAGWHEVAVTIEPRTATWKQEAGYRKPPRTRLAWAFTEPYRRTPVSLWGGRMMHPEYKGEQRARRFRRRIVVPEPAEIDATVHASATHSLELPDVLEPGEHEIVAAVEGSVASGGFACELVLRMPSGTVRIPTDERWETSAAGEPWVAASPVGMMGALSAGDRELAGNVEQRRSPLLDVAWLEGEESVAGHVEEVWADSTEPPPPSWFCFTAPPGARSMTLPIVGDVLAWVDGEPVAIEDGRLPLHGGGRVALRVQAPAGHRGAACFREHPLMDLGPGTIRTGTSWHRQGLDVFSGVVLHRAEIEIEEACEAILDLDEVAGSVAVRANGEPVGILVCAPWTLPVELSAGTNTIELEVANTLGPMVSRGIPTPFGPEDQRFSGVLGRPRLLVPDDDVA